jgi:Tfp pilus assembly protein PilN
MTAIYAPDILHDGTGDPQRLLPIAVNLLPDEVVAARAGRAARRFAMVVMTVVAVITGGWYVQARQGADDAADELNMATSQISTQASARNKFAELTTTKSQIEAVRGQLKQATTGNIAWQLVFARVRAATPAHVTLTNLSATATTASQVPTTTAAGNSTSSTNTTTPAMQAAAAPGTLLLTGMAATKDDVSKFSDRLGALTGLADPIVTRVETDLKSKKVTFSLQVTVTTKSLSTRYDSKAAK